MEWAFDDIKPKHGLDWVEVANKHREDILCWGEYKPTFEPCDHNGQGNFNVKWMDNKGQKIRISASEILRLTIRNVAIKYSWLGQFEMTGYTSFNKNMKDS